MLQSIGILGKFGYTILYLPSITFSYLYLSISEPMLTVIPRFSIFGLRTPSFLLPHSELPFFTGVALIGGMWLHQFGVIVYGHEGPSHQPKNNAVVRTVIFGLSLNIPIDELQQTDSYISLLIQGIPLLNRTSILTFLVFLPAGLFKPLLVISTLALGIEVSSSSLGLTGGVLLLVQSSVIVKSSLNRFFPTYVPERSINRIDKAEYKISEERYLSDNPDHK